MLLAHGADPNGKTPAAGVAAVNWNWSAVRLQLRTFADSLAQLIPYLQRQGAPVG